MKSDLFFVYVPTCSALHSPVDMQTLIYGILTYQLPWCLSDLSTCLVSGFQSHSEAAQLKMADCASTNLFTFALLCVYMKLACLCTLYYTSQTHSGSVWRVTWAHPEYGQVLATCSFDRTVGVWEEQGVWRVRSCTCVLILHYTCIL